MSSLSFIIVNFNTKDITRNCIDSILINNSLKDIKYEIIVIDNASSDNSVGYLQKVYSKHNEIKIYSSLENLGFGKANNLGALYSQGELLVLLNSDTLVTNTNFIELINFYSTEVGFLSCKILNEDNSIQSIGYNYPGILNDFKLSILFWNFNAVKKIRYKNYTNRGLFKVDWVSGCFMVCSKENFEKINGFDPLIFMYSEDIDICKRMENIGKNNYVLDTTSIYHLHGKSNSKNIKLVRKLMENKKNYYYVMKKHNMKNIKIVKFLNTIHILLLSFFKKIKVN